MTTKHAYRRPTYRIDRLVTRQTLRNMFTDEWGPTSSDAVHDFIRARGLKPVRLLDPGPIPYMDEDMRDVERLTTFQLYEQERARTRRARELYDINNQPVYVAEYQTPNDDPDFSERNTAMQARIDNLRTDY